MNSIYLHREDLKSIKDFMALFPSHDTVEITSDTSSGIGAIIQAHLHGVTVTDQVVTVTKTIVDESSW